MRRYPFAPLAEQMGVSEGEACRRLKLSGRTEQEYRRQGVSERVADRLAVAAGFHPFSIWPEMAADQIAATGQPCDNCGAWFVARRKDGRFCQRECYRQWWAREVARHRRARPELAERNRERRRRYYAENGEYERARERRRYREKREMAS